MKSRHLSLPERKADFIEPMETLHLLGELVRLSLTFSADKTGGHVSRLSGALCKIARVWLAYQSQRRKTFIVT
jgi:hypothetical protein